MSLQCNGLDDPPKPELIPDKYSAVLRNVFHAMDRAKVPVKHEAKKGYFVALHNAFLLWNTIQNERPGEKDEGMQLNR